MTITNKIRIALAVLTVATFSVIGALAYAPIASANPSYIANTAQTSSATTSPAYATPGTGTSTVPYNAYSQTTSGGLTQKADTATLGVQFFASSTATILGITYEYSYDGIDWYRDFTFDRDNSTTTSQTLSQKNRISLAFASSTVAELAPASNANRSTYLFTVPTPTPYVRAVFTFTGGNGAVWAQFFPSKELR